jgi:hypothetical protein
MRMRMSYGRTINITTRDDVIRLGVRDSDGERRAWEVLSIADVETLERGLKAAREKIARKRAKMAVK